MKNSFDMFYEFEEEKLLIIHNTFKIFHVKIYDGNTKLENFDKIGNKDYTIDINGDKIIINFYDYIIKNFRIFGFTKSKDFINDKHNWTLQKFIKLNTLFFNKSISDLTEKNIFDSIKNNKVLRKVFYEIESFDKYNYPFENEKIINQIKNSIFIFPFTCEQISALTLKKFGIILINNYIKEWDFSNFYKDDYFFCFLLKGMLYKVIYFHEINFHYIFHLIYANNYSNSFSSPIKLFKSYQVTEGDSGDKDECLLFGKKVRYLFIKAAIFISDDNEYKLEDNYDLIEISKKKFLEYNQPKKLGNLIDFHSITESNNYTKELINIIIKEIKIDKRKKIPKKNYEDYNVFAHLKEDIFRDVKIPLDQIYITGSKCYSVNN